MFFSTKAVLLALVPLISALTERELEQAYQAQTRVISLLKGRQVTTVPCAKVPAPATCASSCGPGWIICPGGSSGDCYNPSTEVCCGDGTTCPAGTTCNNVSLTCDGSGTDPGPTYTLPAATTSTHAAPTSTYTSPSFSTPTTFFGVGSTSLSSASLFFGSTASTAAASTSTSGFGGVLTKTSSVGSNPQATTSVALSSSGERLDNIPGYGLLVMTMSILAGLFLL